MPIILALRKSAKGEDNILNDNRKVKIQKDLKSELSIIVDVVKQGYGTTNDGNTARSFFCKPELVAEILEIDESLIKRFANILQAMASSFEFDFARFEEYASDTLNLFVELYP